jgi:hypothetical protein
LKIVADYKGSWWHMGAIKDNPAMQIVGSWYITNILDYSIKICRVELKKPKIYGNIFIKKHDQNIYGDFFILPHLSTHVHNDFWLQPPICKSGETFFADVSFIDQYNNYHVFRKMKFLYK